VHRLAREQDGLTLPELLVTLAIAVVISLASFALIETVMSRAGEIGSRVDTTQRARHAMDLITRQLRSQVCVTSTSPSTNGDPRAIYEATPTSVTFFADLSDESHRAGNTFRAPELRRISFEDGKLWERRWTGVQGGTALNPTYSYSGYPNTPTRSYLLTDHVATVDGEEETPIFEYFAFNGATPPKPDFALGTPVTGVQASQIALVTMSFRTYRAQGEHTDRGFTVLKNTVYARHADSNATDPKPVCS